MISRQGTKICRIGSGSSTKECQYCVVLDKTNLLPITLLLTFRKYGVSEFMLPLGTWTEVAFTLSVDAFIAAAQRTVQTGASDAPCYIAGQNAR